MIKATITPFYSGMQLIYSCRLTTPGLIIVTDAADRVAALTAALEYVVSN